MSLNLPRLRALEQLAHEASWRRALRLARQQPMDRFAHTLWNEAADGPDPDAKWVDLEALTTQELVALASWGRPNVPDFATLSTDQLQRLARGDAPETVYGGA